MLLPRIDVYHFSKVSFNGMFHFSLFVVSAFQWWILKSFKGFFFFLLPSSKSTTRNTEFATSLLGLPFSSSCNASYITFKVSSWCFLFVAIFIASATVNRIQTNLKILKHSNIMAFELKHSKFTVEYRKMKKLDSERKIRITWWKIRPGHPKICSI